MARQIPWYDVSKRATLNERVLAQQTPLMYSSNWHEFGSEVLNNNKVIKNELRRIADRGLYAAKRMIPLGDAKDGHMRNELKVVHRKKGGRYRDRDVFTVEYRGEKPQAWGAALRRSSFASAADFKNASRGVYGPVPDWLQRAATAIER